MVGRVPKLGAEDNYRRGWPKDERASHVSLGQLKVMSAIETCRTAAASRTGYTIEPKDHQPPCLCGGGRMSVIENFERRS